MKHTLGPWVYELVEHERVFGHESGAFAITRASRQEIGRIRCVLGFEAARANARLIASTPDLLEACRRWVAELEPLSQEAQTTPLAAPAGIVWPRPPYTRQKGVRRD